MTTLLRHGDRSQAVRDLQKKLNVQGAKLVADGDYGDATEADRLSFDLDRPAAKAMPVPMADVAG